MSLLYKKNREHKTFLTDPCGGPFRIFLGVVRERTLKNCLMESFKAEFGEDMIERSGRGRKVFSLVKPKFRQDRVLYMPPMDSQELGQVDYLNQFASGSKIAFRREVTPGSSYLHTGILVCG